MRKCVTPTHWNKDSTFEMRQVNMEIPWYIFVLLYAIFLLFSTSSTSCRAHPVIYTHFFPSQYSGGHITVSYQSQIAFVFWILKYSANGAHLITVTSLWARWRLKSPDVSIVDCLLNRLFGRRSKKTATPRVSRLCKGNSPVTRCDKVSITCKVFPFNDVIEWTWLP